jgi:hypothetical protein
LVDQRLGHRNAERVLAIYFIPGMGHGGMEYDNLIGGQIDALEQWIDYRKSGGKKGALPPESVGGYSRELVRQRSVGRSRRWRRDILFFLQHFDSTGRLLFMRDTTLMSQPFNASKLQLEGEATPVAESIGVRPNQLAAAF